MRDEPMPETVTIQLEDLRAIFDLAVNSLNFNSGFWTTEDVEIARRIAVIIGVDPMKGTPFLFASQYPHEWKSLRPDKPESYTPEFSCLYCGKPMSSHVLISRVV